MSLDVRKITNGKRNYIYVRDDLNDKHLVILYEKKEDVPESIRHYVHDENEYVFWGPDMARIMGVQKLLYPEFLNRTCGLLGYEGYKCCFETCGCSNPKDDYEKCKYAVN